MKSNSLEKLTPKQLHVLPYLVACTSYEEAARQSDISSKQIYQWLKMPLFAEELSRQRQAIFSNAIKALQTATLEAVSTLRDCLKDENTRNRISAADKILSHAFHAAELYEITERLDQVETCVAKALEQQNNQKEKA